MRAYSYDLRQRILHAVDQGKPRAEISKTFEVSRATIKRYLKLRRETGDVKPRTIPGRPAKKGAALLARLQLQLNAYPDATLAEHCQIWETTQRFQVSTATMSRAIQHLDWTRKKKTLRASEQKEAEREPISPFWQLSPFRAWAKRSFLKGRRIAPFLSSILNKFWHRVCTQDKS
jgi:transposase